MLEDRMKVSAVAWILAAALAVPASAMAFGGHDAGSPAPADAPIPLDAIPLDSAAPAVTNADAELIVLYASNDNSGIDAAIGKMPELGKPPFSSFNSYKLVDRKDLSLKQGKTTDVALPTGSTLSITFKDILLTKSKETRYVLTESVVNGDKTVLPNLEVNAKRGEFFFLAGEKYKDGALVIGTRVK
jgi:hypothetical protein